LFVTRIFSGNHDQLAAPPARLAQTHAGADAVATGLIATAGDHARAHRHRFAAQLRIVPLLQRREERVAIKMEDGARRRLKSSEWRRHDTFSLLLRRSALAD
jgi:hypothetical protein